MAATFLFHPFILLIEVFVKMHVLLLKEPRDGESGPDPYIKVDTLYPNALVCFAALGSYMNIQQLSVQHYNLNALHFTANFERTILF